LKNCSSEQQLYIHQEHKSDQKRQQLQELTDFKNIEEEILNTQYGSGSSSSGCKIKSFEVYNNETT